MIEKIKELIKEIENNDNSEEKIEEIYDNVNDIIDYFNEVVKMEMYVFKLKDNFSSSVEYKLKQMDENRRFAHDLCINAMININTYSQQYKLEPVFAIDTNDRYKVAECVGDFIQEIYKTGITKHKNFDEVVLDFSSNNYIVDNISDDFFER